MCSLGILPTLNLPILRRFWWMNRSNILSNFKWVVVVLPYFSLVLFVAYVKCLPSEFASSFWICLWLLHPHKFRSTFTLLSPIDKSVLLRCIVACASRIPVVPFHTRLHPFRQICKSAPHKSMSKYSDCYTLSLLMRRFNSISLSGPR